MMFSSLKLLFDLRTVMRKTFVCVIYNRWLKYSNKKEILGTILARNGAVEKVQLIYLSKERMSTFWKRDWIVIILQVDINFILELVKAWFKQEIIVSSELGRKKWFTVIDTNCNNLGQVQHIPMFDKYQCNHNIYLQINFILCIKTKCLMFQVKDSSQIHLS